MAGFVITSGNKFYGSLSWNATTQRAILTAVSGANSGAQFFVTAGNPQTVWNSIVQFTDIAGANLSPVNPPDYTFSSRSYGDSTTPYLTRNHGTIASIPKASFIYGYHTIGSNYVLYYSDRNNSGVEIQRGYYSDVVEVFQNNIPPAPAAPTLLSVAANICNNSFSLNWSEVSGEDAYAIWRSTDGVNYSLRGTTAANVTTYVDTGAVTGVTYYYKVASRWSNLWETFSNVISKQLTLEAPILNSVTYNAVSNFNALIYSNLSSCFDYIQIERKTGTGLYSVLTTLYPTIPSTYNDSEIVANTTYTYRIRGNYNGLFTSYSNEITVFSNLTPPIQKIETFYPTGSHTFTVPAGVTRVDVFCIGGGAAGQNGANSGSNYTGLGGDGGRGGTFGTGAFNVTTGEVASIQVGAGGSSSGVGSAWGTAGQESFFQFSGTKRVRVTGGNQRTETNGFNSIAGNISGTAAFRNGGLGAFNPSSTTLGGGGGGGGGTTANGTNGGGVNNNNETAGVGGTLYGGNGGAGHSTSTSIRAGKTYGGGGAGGTGSPIYWRAGNGGAGTVYLSYTNPYFSVIPVITSVVSQSLSSQLVTFNIPAVTHNYILIERQIVGSGDFVQIGSVASGVTTFLDTNVVPNVQNRFRIRAIHTPTNSITNYSAIVSNTPIFLAPVLSSVSFNSNNKTATLNFSNPNSFEIGTTEFYIERDYVLRAIKEPTATSYVDNGFTNNRNYFYRVRLRSAGGVFSPFSTILSLPIYLPAPAQTNLTFVQQPCIPLNYLSWNQVFSTGSTGTGYRVFRAIDNNPYVEVASGGTLFTEYSDFDLVLFNLYTYYIEAFDTFAGSSNSTVKSAQSALNPPTLSATPTLTGITLSWISNNVCDTGYRIQRRLSPSGTFADIAGYPTYLTGLTYVDTTAAINTPYDYRMISTNGTYQSIYSSIVTATINVTPPIAPTLHTVSGLTPTTILVSWTNNQPINVDESVKTFKVFRENLAGGGYQEVASVSSGITSTVITETINGNYRYYVQALSLLASSDSNTLTLPLYPNSLSVSRSAEDELNLQLFNTSTFVTGIELFRSTGGTYNLLTTLATGTTNYTNTGLDEDITYSYKFRYKNTSGVTSIFSIPASGLTYLSTPVESSVTQVGLTKMKIDWIDNSSKETNYEIYRNRVGSQEGFQLLATVSANTVTYTDTTVSANNEYEYYVRAIKTN